MYKENFLLVLGVLVLGFLVTLVHSSSGHDDNIPKFDKLANQMLCGRRFKTNFSNGGYSFTVRSSSLCLSRNNDYVAEESNHGVHVADDNGKKREDSGRRANILTFNLNSVGFPNFALRALHADTVSKQDFFTRFGFDRIVEYTESGQTPGFQPSQDAVVRSFFLSNFKRKSGKWSPINCVNADDSAIMDEPIVCNATLVTNDNSNLIQRMTIQAIVTPVEVQIQMPSGITKAKKILTPNSIKLSVEIDGIAYTNSNTSIAVGGFFIIRGSEKREDSDHGDQHARRISSRDSEEERPDEPTVNQGVVQVSDNSSTLGGGFFSWDKYISVKNAQGVYTSVSLTSSTIGVETENEDLKDFLEDSEYKIARIWFSPDEQVSNLLWDPSAGAAEEAINSTSSFIKNSSMHNLLFTLVMCILFCTWMW